MRPTVETLEARRLLSGGVDGTFGSATGAALDAPGETPVLLDSAVDPAGRVVLAGRTSRTVGGVEQPGMWLARLNAFGQLDGKFGVGGILSGTPRGFQQLDLIVPLASGGYVAAENTTDAAFTSACRIVRFKPNGFIDPTF